MTAEGCAPEGVGWVAAGAATRAVAAVAARTCIVYELRCGASNSTGSPGLLEMSCRTVPRSTITTFTRPPRVSLILIMRLDPSAVRLNTVRMRMSSLSG